MIKLDRSVEINTFNQEVKNKELMIKMCRRSNQDKNLSKFPTSNYITDLAESIIMQEWLSGKDNYITSRASRFRWLVSYNGVDGEKILDSWKGWLDDHSDSCTPVSDENSNLTKFLKKFGLIPRFKRAYEIIYSKETSCLSCSCGMWN